MFVERMKVLKCDERFQVYLSTFSVSTGTYADKTGFQLDVSVCVYLWLSVIVGEKICQKISYEKRDRFEPILW